MGVMASLFVAATPLAASASVIDEACKTNPDSTICNQTKDSDKKTNKFIQDVISTLFFAIGAIAVIVIVVGGIKYATADGDSGKIASAKNTILYAVVGLVVALLANAIVFFVVGRF